MKIIIDVMSGDNAPTEILRGASLAVKELNCELILVGNKDVIAVEAGAIGFDISTPQITIEDCDEVIGMDESPMSIRTKKNSSLVKALELLKQGDGDAVVSAGNTGALYTGATTIVSRIKGYRKAAIATLLPFTSPVLLIDAGANTTVTEDILEQFAFLGNEYMKIIFGINSPRIGLLNNGTENNKGTKLLQETYRRFVKKTEINFVGNVEGSAIPQGVCDVLVTDGFSGNLILKYTEGLFYYIRDAISPEFKDLKNNFCFAEHGGAPLLGISKPVIKAHGASDAKAIKNAIRQARIYAKSGLTEYLSNLKINTKLS